MALLGGQLAITLIMASIMHKMHTYISLGRWLLCNTNLMRYLSPDDDQLRAAAGIGKEKVKGKNGQKYQQTFHVPRNINLDLEAVKVHTLDVMHLSYFAEYQWLIDFSIYASIVFICSEVYCICFPTKEEVNLSMIWCLLAILFALKLLGSLTVRYFRSDESMAERSMCIVAFFVYMLIAMIILTLTDEVLETGLENAYASFNRSASKFLNEQGVFNSGPASEIVIKFFIAVSCGLLGSLFTFPGLRVAQMHLDSLKYCKNNKLMLVLLNTSLIMPFVLVILWIKPICRDLMTNSLRPETNSPMLTNDAFDTIRICLMIFTILLRFSLVPTYLQAYLNLPYVRIEAMKKEGGRITNIELKQKVSSVSSYLCAVALQVTAPLVLCLYLTLMYKTLGGYSWMSIFKEPGIINETPAEAYTAHMSWSHLRKVLTTEVYKGLFGFAIWWSYFSLFTTSALGVFYNSYYRKV